MLIIEVIINVVYFFINIFSKNKKIYKKILSTQYRRFVLLVIVSTIPTGIIGYLISDMVESAATGLLIPGISLLVTGVLLLLSDIIPDGYKKS